VDPEKRGVFDKCAIDGMGKELGARVQELMALETTPPEGYADRLESESNAKSEVEECRRRLTEGCARLRRAEILEWDAEGGAHGAEEGVIFSRGKVQIIKRTLAAKTRALSDLLEGPVDAFNKLEGFDSQPEPENIAMEVQVSISEPPPQLEIVEGGAGDHKDPPEAAVCQHAEGTGVSEEQPDIESGNLPPVLSPHKENLHDTLDASPKKVAEPRTPIRTECH